MKTAQLRRPLRRATMTAMICCLVAFVFQNSVTAVRAQAEKKAVSLAETIKPPLKFAALKVGGQDRKFAEGFEAELDWVKALAFELENISGKPIVFLQINVNFPETRATGNLMSYSVIFGERPWAKVKDVAPLSFKPGQSFGVSLDQEKEKIAKFIMSRQPIETIQKVELEIGFVVFEDKTAWSAGTMMRRDPDNPGRFIPLEGESPR
jgi:hypothetical protein